MKLNAHIFEQTHRYLSDQMKEDERLEFLEKLETDAELWDEVETQRQIKTAYLTAYQINEYKSQLTNTHANLLASGQLWQPAIEPVEKPKVADVEKPVWQMKDYERIIRHIGLPYYAMAASVAAIIGWYVLRPQPDINGNPIAKRNTDHKPAVHPQKNSPVIKPTVPVSAPEPTPEAQLASRFNKLFDQYFSPTLRRPTIDANEPRFSGSRPNPAAIERIGTDTTAIIQGIALLKSSKTKPAIAALEPATSCALPDWQANARWFLALAYLKQKQPVKARPLLETLVKDQENLYQIDAKALLDQL